MESTLRSWNRQRGFYYQHLLFSVARGASPPPSTPRILVPPRPAGVDTSEAELEKARQTYPRVPFRQLDAFDIAGLLALRREHAFNKIFLDVNGSRDAGG